MTLGQRIEERLTLLGLTQSDLARSAAVAQTTINSLIRGNSRSTPHLVKIARALRTTPAWLTGETDDPDSEAPDAPLLDSADLELIELVQTLDPKSRAAVVQIIRALASGGQVQTQTLHDGRRDYRSEAA